ncbi:rCG44846, partial [Rattus norvegicus]
MVVHTCDPNIQEAKARRIMIPKMAWAIEQLHTPQDQALYRCICVAEPETQ